MSRLKVIGVAIAMFSSLVLSQDQGPVAPQYGSSQILSVLKGEFQKKNPIISRVELYDVRPLFVNPIHDAYKPNHYLVVARGGPSDQSIEWRLEDELIGLFLFDDSLCAIERTVALLPTQHWGDFIVKVVKVWKDSVTVQGFDFRDADTTSFVKRYSLLH